MKKQPQRFWFFPRENVRPARGSVDHELQRMLGKFTRNGALDAPELMRQVQLWIKRRAKALKIVTHTVEFHLGEDEDIVQLRIVRRMRPLKNKYPYVVHAAQLVRNNGFESRVQTTFDLRD